MRRGAVRGALRAHRVARPTRSCIAPFNTTLNWARGGFEFSEHSGPSTVPPSSPEPVVSGDLCASLVARMLSLPQLLSTACATPPSDLLRLVRPHRRRRRSLRPPRRRPPCRRPASSQPSHATSMCRLARRLPQLPLLLSTACATSLSNLPRLVRPRRRRRRSLRPPRRRPPCRRPASSQPSHATSMCRLATRLPQLPLLLSTACATSLSNLPRLVRPHRRRRRSLRPPRRRRPNASLASPNTDDVAAEATAAAKPGVPPSFAFACDLEPPSFATRSVAQWTCDLAPPSVRRAAVRLRPSRLTDLHSRRLR